MRPQVNPATAAAVALIACAGCAVFAPKAEYCLYREITETKSVARLVMLYSMYRTDYPEGAYSEQIATMRPEIEREIFMAAGEDQYKLMTYVELFPDGIYTVLAQQKIAQIQYMEEMQEAQQLAMLAAQEAAQLAAEEQRIALLGIYQNALYDWLGIALMSPYGMTVEELAARSPRFAELWSTEPVPSCDATSCTKHVVVETWYQVPGATRVDRKLELVIKLVFEADGLLGLSVNFPGRGVLPLLEMVDGMPYDMDEDTLELSGSLVYAMLSPSMPEGTETQMDGALWAWSLPGATIAFTREASGGGVTDALLVKLEPPPPPPLPPGTKPPKKKKGEPEPPPPPVATFDELRWTAPSPPPLPGAPLGAPPVAPAAPGTMEFPAPPPGTMEITDTE